MVVFYVMSATVLFHSISLIEISQLAKLSSQVNTSVGTNKFINEKLDNSFLNSVCAKLKFENVTNVTSATVELPFDTLLSQRMFLHLAFHI